MTKTTKTTMSALALAAAAFATTTLLAGIASAEGLKAQGTALTGPATSQAVPPKVTRPGSIPVKQAPVNQAFPPPHRVLGITVMPGSGTPPHPVIGIPVHPMPGSGNNGGGIVVSCNPKCTVTGGKPGYGGDRDHDHDHDWDRDHDHDYDRDHDHDYHRWFRNWGYWYPRWNWTLPPVYTDYAVSPVESCTYEYKWQSTYVPGFGLRRALVKFCAAY
jgi:hypothetical protein